jgi:hypothetical protein
MGHIPGPSRDDPEPEEAGMKINSRSPLAQFNDQEGTHFGKHCDIICCDGLYRRYHKNDMPICDMCGHVYRSGITYKDVVYPPNIIYLKEYIKKHKQIRFLFTFEEIKELVSSGHNRLVDPTNLSVAFNPQNAPPEYRKRKASISMRQWKRMAKA